MREAYLEANISVLKDVFLAEYLSLDLASRYSDYSNFGSTTNSKVGVMWKPVNDLLVRGTWAEGLRAPSLGDTFGGGSQSFVDYLDICDSVNGDAATNQAGNRRRRFRLQLTCSTKSHASFAAARRRAAWWTQTCLSTVSSTFATISRSDATLRQEPDMTV